METTPIEHLNPEQLAAFASARLPEDAAKPIRLHLAGCEACRATLDRLHGAATIAGPAAPAPPFEGPPELAGHPRYRVLGLLGAGGMGAVYKAEHRLMERAVALKVINPGLVNRPAMVERFRREVKAAARLAHPNIVTAHDADQAGDTHFLVMEFVEGISLDQRVQREGRLPVAEACEYARQAALGLQHAFERGMIHRDVKPQNLMRTPDGQVKILDFGMARFAREAAADAPADAAADPDDDARPGALTQAGSVMGTADFIAPEQADDPRRADIRADVYSLGCTLYYLLAGHAPFPDGTVLEKLDAHRQQTPTPLTKVRGDVSAQLQCVLARMTAKDPGQRYHTPAQAAEALAPFTRPVRRTRRIRFLGVAALLLGVAVLVGVGIYLRSAHQPAMPQQQRDEDKIQGAWRAVSYEEEGKAYPAFVFATKVRLTMTFEGDQVRTRTEYLDPAIKAARPDLAVDDDIQGVFSLNAGTNPKRLSWFRPGSTNSALGIYSLDGDNLTICYYRDPQKLEYPTEVRSTPGSGTKLLILSRETAAPPP